MSLNIQYFDTSGYNIYALIFNTSGQIYNNTSRGFDTYTDSSIDTWDLPLSENGSRRGQYTVSTTGIATIAKYDVEIYRRIGGSPSKTADVLKTVGQIFWNGEVPLDSTQPPVLKASTYITQAQAGETIAFSAKIFNGFGNPQSADRHVGYIIYREGVALNITGVMAQTSSGFYYGTQALTSTGYLTGKTYQISMSSVLAGTQVGDLAQFSIAAPIIAETDVLNQLGYATGTVQLSLNETNFLTNLASSTNDFYNGQVLRFTSSGSLYGQARIISDYVGATKTVTLNKGYSVTPSLGDAFLIYSIGGELNVT